MALIPLDLYADRVLMEILNYYATTLGNAFQKLLPLFIFLVGGYFIFIRMPFLFFRKSMDNQKKQEAEGKKEVAVKDYTVEDYLEFQRKMKLMNGEIPKLESGSAKKEEKKTEEKNSEQKRTESRQKQERVKRPAPAQEMSPEKIFGFQENQQITKSELKKRYFELLKQNHPDRVAAMGADFKKLAEKNTKDINTAYEKLKKKAA